MATKAKTQKQAPAAPVAQAPAAPVAQAVALRGGAAVVQVQLTGKQYRTAAEHNKQWYAAIVQACSAGPAPVAGLLVSPTNAQGVPAHFVGYCLRRGYLAQVA